MISVTLLESRDCSTLAIPLKSVIEFSNIGELITNDECRDLLLSHGVKIIQAKSKRSTSIAERDHQEFEKHSYIRQDAVDFHLPLTERWRSWVKGLRINDDIYNDTPTRLIHMSPNEAVKRALKGEKIFADPSVKHRRPIGFDEPRLSYKDSVLYLLEPG
ncbi:11166_t:CDS:2 [Ambispora gerdemannii]|uniref:11166_t:CDS:1 n=1 Tax=Ambispora gerdemannii TaxID=144530 RepID=A0A9N9AZY3_9GLOM|nr:11166_t:CDS:2 [Ambispora gerdemannii]